tara:strand:- start:10 stop:162 length:153 start_codon:yes stop_codon:yes gene_type:complete
MEVLKMVRPSDGKEKNVIHEEQIAKLREVGYILEGEEAPKPKASPKKSAK